MIKTNIFKDADSHRIIDSKGSFYILEYQRDVSVTPETSARAYFASKMNIRKKQLVVRCFEDHGVILQKGEMQMVMGDVDVSTNVKGAGDLVKKLVGSKITNETAIKPRYVGNGIIVLEPTYKHIILEDLDKWNGSITVEDGMFLACDESVDIRVTARTSVSSVAFGKEGLFSTTLMGSGIVALESPVPADELIEIELEDDVVKIDGNMAIAWSNSLKFTVETSTKTITGSAIAGEGLVNVYRGTGRILVAPIDCNDNIAIPQTKHDKEHEPDVDAYDRKNKR